MTENKRSKEEILDKWGLAYYCTHIGRYRNSALAAMEEHAQQQLTPSWVKASERLPEQNKRLNLKWMSEPNYGIYDSCGMFIVGELKEKYPIEEIEWLDEQPNQTP